MRKPNTFEIVRALVYLQAVGAAAISFTHIVTVGQRYGLTWEAWVAPALIDGFAILGAIGRSRQFSEATRRTGFRLMICAGLVSLVCNIHAGENIGQRVFGGLVVAGFVVAEWYASRLSAAPTPEPTVDEVDAELKAKRSAAALKAAATRKANRAVAERAVKAAERETRKAAKQRLTDMQPSLI